MSVLVCSGYGFPDNVGRAGIHRRDKLETGWIGYFCRVRERWICPDSIGSRKASSDAAQIQVAHQEKARRYAPTKFTWPWNCTTAHHRS